MVAKLQLSVKTVKVTRSITSSFHQIFGTKLIHDPTESYRLPDIVHNLYFVYV